MHHGVGQEQENNAMQQQLQLARQRRQRLQITWCWLVSYAVQGSWLQGPTMYIGTYLPKSSSHLWLHSFRSCGWGLVLFPQTLQTVTSLPTHVRHNSSTRGDLSADMYLHTYVGMYIEWEQPRFSLGRTCSRNSGLRGQEACCYCYINGTYLA